MSNDDDSAGSHPAPSTPSASTRAWLRRLDERRRSLPEEIEEDIAPVRGLSLDQRGELLASVCRDAMAILQARPDFERSRQWSEPRSAESMALWLRLVREARAARGRLPPAVGSPA